MSIDALLFDLDGTLADSLDDLTHATNRVLRARGLPEHDRDAYRYFVGEGARKLVSRALPDDWQDRVDEVLEDFRAEYFSHLTDRTRPYDGVPELLEELDRREVPCAVLSNKPHGATVELVEALFPDVAFRAVYGHREEVPKKPDPTSALVIAEELGLPPARIAFLGDTKTDMQTAVAAGMAPVGVLWGFREAPELREHGAVRLLEYPLDALGLLGT